MVSLADRIDAALRAASERLDALENVRHKLEQAVVEIEALVDDRHDQTPAKLKSNGPARRLDLRVCRGCSREFEPNSRAQVFHSAACRKDHWDRETSRQRRQRRAQPPSDPEPPPALPITSSMDGAVAAQRACSVGFDVVVQLAARQAHVDRTGPDASEHELLSRARRADRAFAAAGLRGLPQELVERRLSLCRPADAKMIRALLD